ncbi:uncharacterized protein LY89DRAFT_763951 [Mollisia scopiformis]|uniref:Fibronectin type-III domain-containing protein n=1 Tax=Mollisia scopiformis TaxID=149040 RepID=A0A132B9V1_MOLSC|nr:uncharacterized protein LY89DRAFT_763951 [Mollisia scopiformis]KUJ08644.1 hypothetical protein LY89DRAFT_763951 [Mollisia scopiformis]
MIVFGILPSFTGRVKADTFALGAVATPFQLSGEHAANNIKVDWSLVAGASSYQIFQSSNAESGFRHTATVPGNTFDDYGLRVGETYYYQVQAFASNGTALGQSTEASAATFTVEDDYDSYDNTVLETFVPKSNLESGGLYYQYNYESDANGFLQFVQQTSTDGFNFAGNTTVLNRSEVCASVPGGYCILQSTNIVKNPTTGNFVMWAHLENNVDYTLAQVAVAEAVPGQPFTFIGTYQPEGQQSRDLTFFEDVDGSGYLISTANNNQDLNLYLLSSNWTTIISWPAILLAGQSREAPAMVHVDDYYYLFTSNTAGWYPSQGQYISASDLAGPWSESRDIGNTANFGAQSGWIATFGTQMAMMADRWGAEWAPPEESNSQRMLPISFGNGYATYGFYETIKYNVTSGGIVPVQSGKILSIGKPVSDSGLSTDAPGDAVTYAASKANDGIQTDEDNYFKSNFVPFWWQVDLQTNASISQIDMTTNLVKGSETYYGYTIMASWDGSYYIQLVDGSTNTAVGFVSNKISSTYKFRYIKVNVYRVVNVQNGGEADWARGVDEIMVYGTT